MKTKETVRLANIFFVICDVAKIRCEMVGSHVFALWHLFAGIGKVHAYIHFYSFNTEYGSPYKSGVYILFSFLDPGYKYAFVSKQRKYIEI